jgi:CubicO group peptidase (beta-lactamase class C family)
MEKPAGYNEASERASEHLESLVSSQHIPGIQYVVVDADSVLFKYAAGVCDVKTKEKVTHDTLFLSSSCTKVVTAAAVLKLMEAGKVNLQDPLNKYCGHPYGDNLRVQHLLNQSSGIPNPMPLNWLHTAEEHPTYSEPEARETTLKAYPMLTFEPGTKYAYSNLSYWLLSSRSCFLRVSTTGQEVGNGGF